MRNLWILTFLILTSCAPKPQLRGQFGELVYHTLPVPDYAEIVHASVDGWKKVLNCPEDLEDLRVVFVNDPIPSSIGLLNGIYRDSAGHLLDKHRRIEVVHKSPLSNSALSHELSHAILDQCTGTPDASHQSMGCYATAHAHLLTIVQLNAQQAKELCERKKKNEESRAR